jgi:hypothetical protein
MNPLLRKEFRLLLPAWIAALASATLPLWSGWNLRGWSVPCFGLAALFLGLTPFGQEMSGGTFGLLLSQPERRQRFWRCKAGLLALALASAWALFALCWWIGTRHEKAWQMQLLGFAEMAGVTGLLTLLAFSGGLWTTLLLRDVTTAFFATVMVPVTIFSATFLCASSVSGWDDTDWRIACRPLEVYAVAGFFVARLLFLDAEDVAWTGRRISPATGQGWAFRWLAFGFRQKRGPWSALIFKELQLQEITIVLVPLFVLLHLAALAARHFAPQWREMSSFDSVVYAPQWREMSSFDSVVVVVVWMMVSWVVGCVAVAEERRYNTLEGLLCLPVRQRTQFAVKFAVAMALGTVLGGVFPWLLECLGGGNSNWSGLEPLKGLVAAAALVTAIAFFASTMSRGMLQAFAVAFLFPLLLFLALIVLQDRFNVSVGRYGNDAGARFSHLAWPAMIATGIWLAFRNYKTLQTGWRLWATNLAWLTAVLALAWQVTVA